MAASIRDLLRMPAAPEAQFALSATPTRATPGVKSRGRAAKEFARNEEELRELQSRLWAEQERSLLLVLQGMDTSGKDGTISHVMRGMNPQGVRVAAFKTPTPEEKRHGFLWRIRKQLPGPGEIGIFNRSHYEDVLIARVDRLAPPSAIERRYGQINRFERDLAAAGTRVVKVCLHISFEEQRQRLAERLRRPEKRWKFRESDIVERARWDDYMAAYDLALARCSTPDAPWYVLPADRKWYRNWAVSRLLIEELHEMNPRYPQPELDVEALLAELGG